MSALTWEISFFFTTLMCCCKRVTPFSSSQRTKFYADLGISDVPIWGLISEEALELAAPLPVDYKDDGEEH